LGFAGGAGGWGVDAFDVEGGAVARGHPQAAALPADIRVVDAAVDPLGEEPHRVGHAQFDNLAADQHAQGIGLIAGGDRHIGAEPQNVVLVDPGVIGVLLGARVTLKARAGDRIEGKALRAIIRLLCAPAVGGPLRWQRSKLAT
jgi:hypothetical protein